MGMAPSTHLSINPTIATCLFAYNTDYCQVYGKCNFGQQSCHLDSRLTHPREHMPHPHSPKKPKPQWADSRLVLDQMKKHDIRVPCGESKCRMDGEFCEMPVTDGVSRWKWAGCSDVRRPLMTCEKDVSWSKWWNNGGWKDVECKWPNGTKIEHWDKDFTWEKGISANEYLEWLEWEHYDENRPDYGHQANKPLADWWPWTAKRMRKGWVGHF